MKKNVNEYKNVKTLDELSRIEQSAKKNNLAIANAIQQLKKQFPDMFK